MLFITPTCLNPDVMDAEVSLENNNIFRGDSQSGRRGGGVALYVKPEFLPRRFSLDVNADSFFCRICVLLNTPPITAAYCSSSIYIQLTLTINIYLNMLTV